jgi:hypothetical protein
MCTHLTRCKHKPCDCESLANSWPDAFRALPVYAACYGSTVLQASLQLHLLESPSPEVRASSEARLKELWEQ